jgi:hypothetical protein
MDSGGQMTEDIEMREAQLVFAELERQWDVEENRTYALMRELEAAENRLIAAFTDKWRDRGGDIKVMRVAYSHFRKRLLWAAANGRSIVPAWVSQDSQPDDDHWNQGRPDATVEKTKK